MPVDALPSTGAPPAHFLLVEDDPVIGGAVRRAAEGLLPMRLGATGEEALAALRQRPLPRFVLLDFRLPDMDGSEVLRRMRADPDCRELPIIVFSSVKDPDLIRRTLAAGADDWVLKPDEPQSLRDAVRALCLDWREPAPAGEGASGGNRSQD